MPDDETPHPSDPFDLGRFLAAQEVNYRDALAEIRAGQKRTHWMWYVFPQLEGLARSGMSQRYSIKSVAEARAYLAHPVLGPRLLESAGAVLEVQGRTVAELFGSPDDMKLRSCATLFESVSPSGSVFAGILAKYYRGVPDENTLRLLGGSR
ncbi:MAG TPA: DUF1810 domain-containing protein [Gemmatimonadales bacterium]|nr:DUF1810 domain-containing protein [Gemmatimonadales bacterium]